MNELENLMLNDAYWQDSTRTEEEYEQEESYYDRYEDEME